MVCVGSASPFNSPGLITCYHTWLGSKSEAHLLSWCLIDCRTLPFNAILVKVIVFIFVIIFALLGLYLMTIFCLCLALAIMQLVLERFIASLTSSLCLKSKVSQCNVYIVLRYSVTYGHLTSVDFTAITWRTRLWISYRLDVKHGFSYSVKYWYFPDMLYGWEEQVPDYYCCFDIAVVRHVTFWIFEHFIVSLTGRIAVSYLLYFR